MGLLQTQKEIATKTGYPLYFCEDLPTKTLFKKASIEGNPVVRPVYVDIKENQGMLHIQNGILTNFMLTAGFYFIDNTLPTTYGYGQHSFVLTPEQLRLHEFPLRGEHVYYVNLKPVSDVIVTFDKPITYSDANGSYNINCKLSFDIVTSNPVALFKMVVKNSDTEHYLTENLFESISNMLRKHVLQQFEIFEKQGVSHNFIKQNKNVLLQNFENKTASLSQIGLSVTNIDIDELLFTLPFEQNQPYAPIPAQHTAQQAYPNEGYAQPNQMYSQPSNQQAYVNPVQQEFNVANMNTPSQNFNTYSEPAHIEGLNLSFDESELPTFGQTAQYGQPQRPNGNQQTQLFGDEWLCPSCKNEARGNVCGFCGYRREVTAQPMIVPVQQNSQWQCNRCGLVNSLKFCSNCGNKKPEPQPNRCDNCGYQPENPNFVPKFCPECGAKFR